MGSIPVEAVCDVKLNDKFTVAHKGDKGEAFQSVPLSDNDKAGKVFVRFGYKARCYWVQPEDIKFLKACDWKTYVAKVPDKKLFPDSAIIPTTVTFTDYNFGENLKKIRRARHLSQSSLSKSMSTSQAAISFRESKSASPNGKFLSAAAKALNVPSFIFYLDLNSCEGFSVAKKYLGALSSTICGD